MRLLRSVSAVGVACFVLGGCLLPFGNDNGGGGSPSSECTSDGQCFGSDNACAPSKCVDHACQTSNLPDGTLEPGSETSAPACKKIVCDGSGSTRTLADPTNVPTGGKVACKRATCDATGNVSYTPDPSNTPPDEPHDCKLDQCASDGTITYKANPADVPVDTKGDCMKDGCDASGTVTKTVDDTDPPPPATCFSYTCSGGSPVGTPINPTKNCSDEGFVCGADGMCDTCPAPDASCSDVGPGSRVATSAHDFGGIGRTDSGGRWFCGAVPSGATEYYTYYDDGTGFLASFDPYFEIEPQASAKMCVFFDCPSVSCPGSTTADTRAGHPGCCLDAAPGAFTGFDMHFCDGARVNIEVTTTSACAGFELHFHD